MSANASTQRGSTRFSRFDINARQEPPKKFHLSFFNEIVHVNSTNNTQLPQSTWTLYNLEMKRSATVFVLPKNSLTHVC